MSSPSDAQQHQDDSGTLMQQLAAARASQKRARNELACANQQVEALRKACDRALLNEAKARVITEGNLKGVVNTIEITPTGHCKIYFADDTVVCGTGCGWKFTIDGTIYMVDNFANEAKPYKHKLKKVRETVNRLLPQVRYVCERQREFSEYAISDCRADKLRKLEDPVL